MSNESTTKFRVDISELKKGMQEAARQVRLANSEFKAATSGMDNWGKSADGISSKIKQLDSVLDAQNSQLEILQKQYELVAEEEGETSKGAQELIIKINNQKAAIGKTTAELNKWKKALDEVDSGQDDVVSATDQLRGTISKQESELNELKEKYVELTLTQGKNSDEAKEVAKAISKLSSDLKKNKSALDDAEKGADELDDTLEEVSDSTEKAGDGFTVMKGAMADLLAQGISALISGIGDAITGLVNLAEETREYREDLNKLKTAFQEAGHTTEQAKKVFKELYSVFGEEDRAVEAAQQIANIAKSQEDMTRMTEIATGAWAKWGDSLATESLMEAISHTSKLGEVQGTLSDALEWCGISIEDFNKKLSKKNSEEERTEYILSTLEDLYLDSAKLYKENNRSIIQARKATSDYNDTLAELGEEIEPFNTALTEMKTKFLKELTPAIKRKVVPAFEDFTDELEDSGAIEDLADLVGDLAKTALPMLADVLGFLVKNFKTIITTIGITVVAFKTMTIISTVTTAIKGATSAMGAFNAIMAANPIGAVVTVVGVLAAGFLALTNSTGNTIDAMELFTDEEVELIEQTKATTEAIQEMKDSVDKTSGSLTAEMDHTKALAKELMNLADENGRVEESDRTRAQFILNELNQALGTEYTMTGNIIGKYAELERTIYDVIDAKTASALLEAHNEAYVEAIQNEGVALQQVNDSYDLYQEKLVTSAQAEEEYQAAYEQYMADLSNAKSEYDIMALASDAARVAELKRNADEEKAMLNEAKKSYDDSAANYGSYQKTINDYENASMLIQKGNNREAIDLLKNKGQAYFDYSDDVSEATKEAVDALYEEAVKAGIEAKRTKENFENGVEGYTEEMVKEAEEGYDAALEKWATAYQDANGVGKDLGSGLAEGMESERGSLITKAKSIVDDIINGMRNAADSHSPSRKTIAFGEDLGAGTEIGLENKTGDIVKSARNQVEDVLNTYMNLGSVINDAISGTKSTVPLGNNKLWISKTAQNLRKSSRVEGIVANSKNSAGTTNYNFYQTNNSPKALSRYEIYRQSKNLLNRGRIYV